MAMPPNPPELSELARRRLDRLRRVRRLMRPLPRRSNLGRYPILKYFAGPARRMPFLWSYRPEHVRPALYIGSILTLLPLIGVQLVLALAACVLLRGNLPITAALQLISNPLTAAPLYGLTYAVGAPFTEWLLPAAGAAWRIPTALGLGAVLLGLVLAGAIHLVWELSRRRRQRELTSASVQRQNRGPTRAPENAC